MTLTYVSICSLLFCVIIYYRIHAEKTGAERKDYLGKYSRSLNNVEDLAIIVIAIDAVLEEPASGLLIASIVIFSVYATKGIIRKHFSEEDN